MAANVTFLNPPALPKPPGFTHVVEAAAPARLIYIAGQLGHGSDNKVLGAPGDFRSQCIGAFENLGKALASVGATFADLVKVTNYLVDMSHIGIFRDVRDSYFNTAAPPASTTVAVAQLARPEALFEIEAVAVLPAKAAGPGRAKAGARRARQAGRPSRARSSKPKGSPRNRR